MHDGFYKVVFVVLVICIMLTANSFLRLAAAVGIVGEIGLVVARVVWLIVAAGGRSIAVVVNA